MVFIFYDRKKIVFLKIVFAVLHGVQRENKVVREN